MSKMKNIKSMFEENKLKINVKELSTKELTNIEKKLNKIEDKRNMSYVKHNMVDVLMITLLAVLANANSWVEIEEFAKIKCKF